MRSLCFLDVETGGLDHKTHGILSIATIVELEGKTVSSSNWIIGSSMAIDDKALEVNGLTREQVLHGRPESEMCAELSEMIGQYDPIFVMHNAPFDYMFVGAMMRRCGYQFNPDFIDTLSLSRILDPKAPGHKLAQLIQLYGLKEREAHHAMGDTMMCRDLYHHLMTKAEQDGVVLDPVNLLATWKKRQPTWPHERVKLTMAG